MQLVQCQLAFMLPLLSTVPSAPLNFMLSSVSGSPNQLSASWTSPTRLSASITAYKVYCNTSASQAFPEQVIGPNAPTVRSEVNGETFNVTFSTGLNPFTQYDCYVAASNPYGEGASSTMVTSRTDQSSEHTFIYPRSSHASLIYLHYKPTKLVMAHVL